MGEANEPMAAVKHALHGQTEEFARSLTGSMLEALRSAYMAGVRDGFVQGVEAAERKEEDHG